MVSYDTSKGMKMIKKKKKSVDRCEQCYRLTACIIFFFFRSTSSSTMQGALPWSKLCKGLTSTSSVTQDREGR